MFARSYARGMELLATSDSLMTIMSVLIVSAVIGHSIWYFVQERRTARLRPLAGDGKVSNALNSGSGQREARVRSQEPTEGSTKLNIRLFAPADRTQFVESWARVQASFADDPGSAVTRADQLLVNMMSVRGFPMGDFEQHVAKISVGHPVILDNYRGAHQRALRHMRGMANQADLFQAMVHYRVLFDELMS